MNENSFFRKAGEELKKDREKMKGKSPGQKLEYFFMYYKIPVIIAAAVAVIAISVLHTRSQYREYAFHALFFNAADTVSDEKFSREFGNILDIDTDSYTVTIDSSLSIDGYSQLSIGSSEKLAGEVNSQILDVCIMPEDLFLTYAGEGCYGDLRDFLTEEQLKQYAEALVYLNDIPVGIKADSFSRIEEAGLYTSKDSPVFGIVYNTPHPAECSVFLDYLDSLSAFP